MASHTDMTSMGGTILGSALFRFDPEALAWPLETSGVPMPKYLKSMPCMIDVYSIRTRCDMKSGDPGTEP